MVLCKALGDDESNYLSWNDSFNDCKILQVLPLLPKGSSQRWKSQKASSRFEGVLDSIRKPWRKPGKLRSRLKAVGVHQSV